MPLFLFYFSTNVPMRLARIGQQTSKLLAAADWFYNAILSSEERPAAMQNFNSRAHRPAVGWLLLPLVLQLLQLLHRPSLLPLPLSMAIRADGATHWSLRLKWRKWAGHQTLQVTNNRSQTLACDSAAPGSWQSKSSNGGMGVHSNGKDPSWYDYWEGLFKCKDGEMVVDCGTEQVWVLEILPQFVESLSKGHTLEWSLREGNGKRPRNNWFIWWVWRLTDGLWLRIFKQMFFVRKHREWSVIEQVIGELDLFRSWIWCWNNNILSPGFLGTVPSF